MSLVEFVASTPLTPLLKFDGGIHLITISSILRCLVSKVVMKGVCRYVGIPQSLIV